MERANRSCITPIQNHHVMIIHSFIPQDVMFQLATGNNLILAGDFNFKPETECHRAVTNEHYFGISVPKSNRYTIYESKPEQVFKSAYREKNGSESTFTNLSY